MGVLLLEKAAISIKRGPESNNYINSKNKGYLVNSNKVKGNYNISRGSIRDLVENKDFINNNNNISNLFINITKILS